MFSCFFLTGFIKDVTGSYDLMFYLGVGSSLYITIATIIVVIIKKCCHISNTYKSPKIEYRQIDGEANDEIDNSESDAKTKLLNGYVAGTKAYDSVKITPGSVHNHYDSVTRTSEVDNIYYNSSEEERSVDSTFDIDTASIIVNQNSSGKLTKTVFSKTL